MDEKVGPSTNPRGRNFWVKVGASVDTLWAAMHIQAQMLVLWVVPL